MTGFALQKIWLRQAISCQGKTEALGESAALRPVPELLEKQVIKIVMTLLNQSTCRRSEGIA
ncbi:hypothetical protein [Ruegeria atlantica]|uniref:hypothetical protein n=1 Tax=Ruegeria atlantica TaxID=81569 RepID=UPI00147CAFA3|nr:hypothetical protein [Ruegeria atlantica]